MSASTHAEAEFVPAEPQAEMFTTLGSYDRNMSAHVGEGQLLKVAILVIPTNVTSRLTDESAPCKSACDQCTAGDDFALPALGAIDVCTSSCKREREGVP